MFHEQTINSSKYKECMVAQTQKTIIMTNLKETADKVLNSIYNDSNIVTKQYTEMEALLELKSAIEFAISKLSK